MLSADQVCAPLKAKHALTSTDPDPRVRQFCCARLSNRERFATQVDALGFYSCRVKGVEHVVRVACISAVPSGQSNGKARTMVDVDLLEDVSMDKKLHCPILLLTKGQRIRVPIENINHPLHVIPYCIQADSDNSTGGSTTSTSSTMTRTSTSTSSVGTCSSRGCSAADVPKCTVLPNFKLPPNFNPCCFALNGNHVCSDRYALNPFFIK